MTSKPSVVKVSVPAGYNTCLYLSHIRGDTYGNTNLDDGSFPGAVYTGDVKGYGLVFKEYFAEGYGELITSLISTKGIFARGKLVSGILSVGEQPNPYITEGTYNETGMLHGPDCKVIRNNFIAISEYFNGTPISETRYDETGKIRSIGLTVGGLKCGQHTEYNENKENVEVAQVLYCKDKLVRTVDKTNITHEEYAKLSIVPTVPKIGHDVELAIGLANSMGEGPE